MKKLLKAVLVVACVPAVLIASIFFSSNLWQHYNVHQIYDDGSVSASKVDGIFSYTKLYSSRNGQVEVENYTYFGLKRRYVDFNGNGEVDSLELDRSSKLYGGGMVRLSRDVDFQKYQNEFMDADRDLKRQLKRFREFFK